MEVFLLNRKLKKNVLYKSYAIGSHTSNQYTHLEGIYSLLYFCDVYVSPKQPGPVRLDPVFAPVPVLEIRFHNVLHHKERLFMKEGFL